MNPFGFDPSKMDPKLLMELSQLVQQLPPDQINRMQSLMHNMMAGYDVTKDMQDFENSLPLGFREKMMSVMGTQGTSPHSISASSGTTPIHASMSTASADSAMNVREARLTILKAVSDGRMTPEEAEKLL